MEISSGTLQTVTKLSESIDEVRNDVVSSITNIDHVTEPISYEQFFKDYLVPNKLCVLGSWATETWKSRREWVTEDGQPDFDFLKSSFGEAKCPIANCKAEKFSSHPKSEMIFHDYIDYVQKYSKDGYPPESDCLYLKDWHFVRLFPAYGAYEVPIYFQSDWMNEFWDKRDDVDDDYRFVYIGPKGSWTPFHSDVFRSFSWSANICGRKKWIFYPPGEEDHLRDNLGNLTFDLNSPEMEDRSRFPNVDHVQKKFVVYQEEGEVVFVPSGWHHQVYNVEDTISINHNWMNGCNIDLCWRHLVASLADVQNEIADCKDMENWGAHCQVMLKACAGMDYAEFYRFLHTIADSRISSIETHAVPKLTVTEDRTEPNHGQNVKSQDNSGNCAVKSESEQETQISVVAESAAETSDGNNEGGHGCDKITDKINHYFFDLKQIRKLLFVLKRNKEFLQLDFDDFAIRPKKLIEKIDVALKMGEHS